MAASSRMMRMVARGVGGGEGGGFPGIGHPEVVLPSA